MTSEECIRMLEEKKKTEAESKERRKAEREERTVTMEKRRSCPGLEKERFKYILLLLCMYNFVTIYTSIHMYNVLYVM